MKRSKVFFSILLLQFCLSLIPLSLSISSGTRKGYTLNGRVKIEGMRAQGLGVPGKISNAEVILSGGQKVSFLRPGGYFSFHNVPAGTHLIEVVAIGYFFSPVHVDVSARNHGKVHVALTENRRCLGELAVEPLREEYYYEMREPFPIMPLLKSPMGLMMGFMLILFVMSKLSKDMDPEDIRQAQEEMRNQVVPSLAKMLPSPTRS